MFCYALCECLTRLTILDKIPKCPLTRFSNFSSDYLTLEDYDFAKRSRYVAECVVIECELTLFFIFKRVKKVERNVFF